MVSGFMSAGRNKEDFGDGYRATCQIIFDGVTQNKNQFQVVRYSPGRKHVFEVFEIVISVLNATVKVHYASMIGLKHPRLFRASLCFARMRMIV